MPVFLAVTAAHKTAFPFCSLSKPPREQLGVLRRIQDWFQHVRFLTSLIRLKYPVQYILEPPQESDLSENQNPVEQWGSKSASRITLSENANYQELNLALLNAVASNISKKRILLLLYKTFLGIPPISMKTPMISRNTGRNFITMNSSCMPLWRRNK